MGWYSVIKTIKGRSYLYRQRTYRQGGKVRTESRYVGAFGGDGRSTGVNVTSFGEPEAQPIKIVDNTTSAPLPRSLRIDSAVQQREGLSMQALVKEEEAVRSVMEQRGLDTSKLKPVRIRIGKTVGWQEHKESYTVNTTKTGHRILTKREYRTALGMRWLDVMRDQDPKHYAFLQHHVDLEYRWMSAALPQVHPIVRFVNWWRGRAPWKMEVAAMAGEMIQHGSRETYQRYYKDAITAEKAANKAWRRFKQLKQPKARRRQYRRSQELYRRSKIASGRHGVAMFTRLCLYGERPRD